MNNPRSVCVDPSTGKVFVVDASNNRVLRFSSSDALTNGSSATGVLGQADFTSGAATRGGATAANTLSSPKSCFVDSGGRLWVSDAGNQRVLRFDSASTKADGANADGVLGQANFTSSGTGITASTMNGPWGLYGKSDRLWVAGASNNRVLRFDSASSKANGANADGVLGQADFTSNGASATASTMWAPYGVVEDSNGALFVAEVGNNRVLRFDSASSKADGANADGVLGQANFTSNGTGTTASTLNSPIGLAIDGSNGLYVYDGSNHRILIFNSASGKADGASADNVLGQTDFVSSGSGTTASTLASPIFGWFDTNKGRLWVAGFSNHRVLSYLNTDLIVSTTTSIPTMTEWGMIIFMILTGMMGVYYLKKNEMNS